MATWAAKADAQYNHIVDSWDSPYTALEGDVASYGLRVDAVEPHVTYPWAGTTLSFFEKLKAAVPAGGAVLAAFNNTLYGTPLITDGRAPNLVEYWSAGSPNWYGASERGRVAIHYGGVLRPVAGRSWFTTDASITFSLALAGMGYVRCTKTVGSTTTEVLLGYTENGGGSGSAGFQLTEADWLDKGYRFSAVMTLAPGDRIDLYYVQNLDRWGGLVAKVVNGSSQTQLLGTKAPVLGAGLFDALITTSGAGTVTATAGTATFSTTQVGKFAPGDSITVAGVPYTVLTFNGTTGATISGTPTFGAAAFTIGARPPIQSWKHIEDIQVKVEQQQAPQATITIPLINPSLHDGFGWEWRKDSDTDPGYLVCWNGGVVQFELHRGRLIRAKAGYITEESTIFTGIVQDIPTPRDGEAQVRCIGFEYRLLENRNKLEPDPISYMTFGYRNLTGVSEPVYGVTAYDAWTVEDAIADSAYRAGTDASRLRQALQVKRAGTLVPVVFGSDAFLKFRARSKSVSYDYVELRSTSSGVGDGYDYRQIGGTISYTVQTGDVLQYDIWQNTKNPEFLAGVDFTTGALSTDKFRGVNILDQNGISNHPHTSTALYSKGKWYRRQFDIGTTFVGKTITSWAMALEGDAPGNYEVRIANVRVRRNGAVVLALYESGAVTSSSWSGIGSNPTSFSGTTVNAVLQTGAALRLERPAHYGNVGTQFTETKPIDDPYLFTPEAKDDAWARVLNVADRYGYDIRFDAVGDLLLTTRSNPCFAYDIEQFDSAQVSTRITHPSAYRGAYIEWSIATTVTKRVTGARIDISLPRGPTLGGWTTITVKRASDLAVMQTYTAVAVTASSDVFYYDYRDDTSGNNATLLTLYSGDFDNYIIELVGTGSATRRLDTIFVYHTDPIAPRFALSTLRNALAVTATDIGDDMRNMVTVVGTRKAATTDSEKFKTNPNNPDPEFIVQVAVDAASISDPTAPNYVGMRRESTIIDSSIADQDYAAYLARTFVYRYRTPRPPADIPHTLIAELALRMPITADEATFKSVTAQSTLWVSGYTHQISAAGVYTTTISTSAWPEFPSFEPRDDIDIDIDFAGVPVANIEVKYVSCSGHTKINLPGSGLVHESRDTNIGNTATASGDVDVWATNVAVTAAGGGQPESLNLAGKPWPPVPGTVMIRPAAGGTSHLTEEYGFNSIGSPLFTSPAAGGLLFNEQNGTFKYTIKLNGQAGGAITNVWESLWGRVGADFTRVSRQLVPAIATATSGYVFDPLENILTVTHHRSERQTQQTGLSFQVEYNKYVSQLGPRWLTNSPYHHLMNVDYRDANRKIYLPWIQGDGSASYQRDTSVTAYDVKYRKLGNVDPSTKAYQPVYGTGSPFFDVTTSELGYLISLTFDALVSGYYRITVRSAFDNTAVAYLTEPNADPQAPEAHWQAMSAGRARSFNWDGVDQLGTWNRKQSDEYAALSQGWFEADSKEAIGANWYVWNREFESGGYARLALISDERNADGTPAYGQGTYAAWYFQIECRNDILAERVADGLPYPRVVRTIEPRANEAVPTYTTGQAAVVYTHMPVPTQLELEVADWKVPQATGTYSFDPSDSEHLADTHWQAPWYNSDLASPVTFEGLINNQAPIRVRFRVVPRTGVLWTNMAGEAEIKLTRHVHLKAQVFDQVAVGEGTTWVSTAAGDTGFEQRTIYNRSFHNDDHTITFVDEGWRKARTLRNSTNPNGVTEWIFRPEDFKKDFGRGITAESLQFGDYLQLGDEVPKWEQQRSAAAPHSRLLISFLAYLFYLSSYCVDRTGRRSWGINRSFIDPYKLPNNAYGHWWDPASTATPMDAATNPTGARPFKAELPYDLTRQQRRSIICRQWVDEGTWRADQNTRWGFGGAGSIGYKLLRHRWQDHDPLSTTLIGATWPVLDQDMHSKWHTDGRTDLPSTPFSTLTRQLGTSSSTRLGTWTWEIDPVWVPCVTRDFHPFFRVPPMVVPTDSNALATAYQYGIVDVRSYDSNTNAGQDAAAGQTWSSWARDMTETYAAGGGGKVRFAPGTKTDPADATVGVTAKSIDYVRQDDCVHFEELRGIYTRGPRPPEAAKKLVPTRPYYFNMFEYDQTTAVNSRGAALDKPIPLFEARVKTWFRLAIRTEYFWESSTFFPVDYQNRENLEQLNVWKARYMGDTLVSGPQQVLYDSGAWTGWKDDLPGSTLYQTGAFETGHMPFTLGPVKGPTTDVYVQLVLVNERRTTPL